MSQKPINPHMSFTSQAAPQQLLTSPWQESLEARVLELLEEKAAVVLITIVQSQGSAPRHAGTRALQTRNGFEGTVGGGVLEAKAMQCAHNCLAKKQSSAANFSLKPNAATSDMICGGQMRILCEWLDQQHKPDFIRAREALRNGQKGFWLVICPKNAAEDYADKLQCTRHLLLTPADLSMLPLAISRAVSAVWTQAEQKPSFMICEDSCVYLEPLEPAPTLLLLGAGHVALEVAKLASACGFVVDVVDDREAFANPERFPMARRCLVLPEFAGLCEQLAIGAGHYLAIMTRGHAYDQTCLEQLLTSKARYLGMIGSRHKKAQIFSALQKKGFSEESLKSVFCPIGLPIKAESPQQIAVSIVAELLAVKGNVRPWCSAGSKL